VDDDEDGSCSMAMGWALSSGKSRAR
jgi:hypothetical protein